MAISKEKKRALLNEYDKLFSEAQVAVITNYQGLNAVELTAMRRQLGNAGVALRVVKNTLVRHTLEQKGVSAPEDFWQGPNAISFAPEDAVAGARAVVEYARNEKRVTIRAGVMGHKFISDQEVMQLAELPSREVLLGQLLGGMQAPIAGLVTVLSGTLRGLVNVLDARVRQMQESAG